MFSIIVTSIQVSLLIALLIQLYGVRERVEERPNDSAQFDEASKRKIEKVIQIVIDENTISALQHHNQCRRYFYPPLFVDPAMWQRATVHVYCVGKSRVLAHEMCVCLENSYHLCAKEEICGGEVYIFKIIMFLWLFTASTQRLILQYSFQLRFSMLSVEIEGQSRGEGR